jgi:hypothetical protein
MLRGTAGMTAFEFLALADVLCLVAGGRGAAARRLPSTILEVVGLARSRAGHSSESRCGATCTLVTLISSEQDISLEDDFEAALLDLLSSAIANFASPIPYVLLWISMLIA